VLLPKSTKIIFNYINHIADILNEGCAMEDENLKQSQNNTWDEFFSDKKKISDDFMLERNDTPPQERELF